MLTPQRSPVSLVNDPGQLDECLVKSFSQGTLSMNVLYALIAVDLALIRANRSDAKVLVGLHLGKR